MTDVQAYKAGTGPADEPFEDRFDDAEVVEVAPGEQGAPVDLPARMVTFADVVSRYDERRPIVPAGLRSKEGRRSLVTLAGAAATHGLLWQLSRMPLYMGRVALYAPNGLRLALWKPVKWASAEEGNWHLRQMAANRGDMSGWIELDRHRMRSSAGRWWVVGISALATIGAGTGVVLVGPEWVQVATEGGALLGLARLGRPSEKPIIDHAFNPARYVRLTAELTRSALMASGAGIKDPSLIKFNREIYRDGPGYTAEVSLPAGVIATSVIDRRDYLAAGFQLPMPQVWPEPVRGAHPGVLAIWVADRPVDRMKQRPSALLTCGPQDYWKPLPWGDDVRVRDVNWRLDERNSLFAGMPGTGKTLAARNVALAAAMDPLVQFAISELKGSGDLDPIEPLCGKNMYASGADEQAKVATMRLLDYLLLECEIRPPLIRKLAVKGLNNVNKVNRAMAEVDPRLRPIVAIFDEFQELVTDPKHGKEAKGKAVSLVKRCRSLGIHLIFATQRIDKESVPRGLSSNISNRFCLGVPSHVETDLVLGTGAYARGARPTTFMPPADGEGENPWAGWGYLGGREQPVRAAYIDNPTAEAIVKRALQLRGDISPIDLDPRQERDVISDVLKVFAYVGRPGLQWQQLAELLAEQMPELYAGATAEVVSALVRAEKVPSVDVKVDGVGLKGCRLDAVQAVAAQRELGG